MYIINTIPHGKCFVRYLRTRFCIRNLTRSLRSLVRFLIRQQLVRKYRTPALSMKYSLSLSNLHGLSCQEKVSRFSMLLIPRNGTSLAVSHWKLRMVLMVEYRSSGLNQNKPFSGPVSTLLSSGFFRIFLWFFCNLNTQKPHLLIGRVKNSDFLIVSELKSVC